MRIRRFVRLYFFYRLPPHSDPRLRGTATSMNRREALREAWVRR